MKNDVERLKAKLMQKIQADLDKAARYLSGKVQEPPRKAGAPRKDKEPTRRKAA